MVFRQSVPILYSSDVRKSINYYMDVFGFDSKWEWDDPPGFGGVSKDRVDLFFCREGQGHPGTWISIMVDNVDELFERIRARGGKIVSDPDDKPWGLREMLAEDPDGHIIRFGQHRKHDRQKSEGLPDNINIVERLPTMEEYRDLLEAVGWKTKETEINALVLKAPVFGAIAEERASGRCVGCVLLLGDNASFYYVKDMMVHPDYQHRNIGRALMTKLNHWIETNAAQDVLVGLYTGENLAPFYGQFGFRQAFGMCRRVSGRGGKA